MYAIRYILLKLYNLYDYINKLKQGAGIKYYATKTIMKFTHSLLHIDY